MARPRYKILEMAAELGVAPAQLVREKFEEAGSVHATAKALGVNCVTVRRWLSIAGCEDIRPRRVRDKVK
jgi:transposase-like protein